jgi:hypothetical protein
MGDVELVEGRGVMITIRHSKTDQHAEGQAAATEAGAGIPAVMRRAQHTPLLRDIVAHRFRIILAHDSEIFSPM